MRRLFVPRARIAGDRAALTASDRHYLRDVLRLGTGDPLQVFDGEGGIYPARMEASGGLALGPRAQAPAPRTRLWLGFALARGEKCDLLVQKATELGAARLSPFEAVRSVVHLEGGRGEKRTLRLARIAAEAARQCGRADVPQVDAPRTLAAVLSEAPPSYRKILLYEGGGESLVSVVDRGAEGHLLLLGPEGGFAEEEVERCLASGARLATLGPRVLRFETAGIAALALVQHLAGDLG
ncbi:MAG TPA: 16S rRNA (uracil(1498)-N(3))-methyltransferase [Anaeromyxobacteraceae bacterium]|nr:16S rRNA (uracil(1498)-N(3))-methyltransferase [Anaeromyxobacteraceae bacterium]